MEGVVTYKVFRIPITIPLNLDSYDYRAICLFMACIVYALFGSPTPDHFGRAEIVITVLLAVSVGIGRARDAVLQPIKRRFWKSAGQAFLIYGLTVPLIVSVVSSFSVGDIIRDVMAFLFLFMPLFLLPTIRARPYYFRSFLFAVLLIGGLFSLRSLVMHFMQGCAVWCVDDLLYLENMPTVLFSALFLIGGAMSFVMRGITLFNVSVFLMLIVLSLLPIAAMAITLQRASLGAVGLYIIILCGYFFYKSPKRTMCMVFLFATLLLFVNISFSSIFLSLGDKTNKVGLNMRPQELAAIWEVMSAHPIRFLFGLGWGSHFNSPAVGGLSVNFTHNFFSSAFLKTGLCGLVLCIAYVVGLLERLCRVIFKNPVLGLALASPILIDLTLYASFKSLDFGLMLLMISGSLVYFRQSESLKVF